MLDETVYAASARPAPQAGAQFGQVGLLAMRHHLHFTVLGVAYPTAQIQFAGLAVYEPAKANPLHATLN